MAATKTQTASSSQQAGIEPELPPLSYNIASTDDEKRDALRLVADTIAQQRQVASTAIIFHPLCLAPFVALISAISWRNRHHLFGAIILLSGFIIAYLAAVQYYTYGYLQRAEQFKWKTFITPAAADKEKPQQDAVMFARYGQDVIAALVLRLNKTKKNSSEAPSAQIRAWATRLRYRNAGVGGDMLAEAVALARASLGPTATIEFSNPHAHTIDTSKYFTAPFEQREKRARQALAQAIKQANEAAKQ